MISTALDANWGYWQLPIAEEDSDKTTIVSHRGTFQCERIPFGLRNASDIFQQALNLIIYGVRLKTCLVYLGDVLIFSKSVKDHIKHVDEVLQLLQDEGVSVNLRKCIFFRKSVD